MWLEEFYFWGEHKILSIDSKRQYEMLPKIREKYIIATHMELIGKENKNEIIHLANSVWLSFSYIRYCESLGWKDTEMNQAHHWKDGYLLCPYQKGCRRINQFCRGKLRRLQTRPCSSNLFQRHNGGISEIYPHLRVRGTKYVTARRGIGARSTQGNANAQNSWSAGYTEGMEEMGLVKKVKKKSWKSSVGKRMGRTDEEATKPGGLVLAHCLGRDKGSRSSKRKKDK